MRYARLGGERGAVFRDPKEVKRMSKKYKTLEANANKACFVKAPVDDDWSLIDFIQIGGNR